MTDNRETTGSSRRDSGARRIPRALWLSILTMMLGALVHTLICWVALQLGFFKTDQASFGQVFGLIWTGHGLLVAAMFINLALGRNPYLAFPLVLWSTLSLLLSAYFVDQVRLCVMVLFFAILQTGVFRLSFRQMIITSLLCILGYAGILYQIWLYYPETMDVIGELIQWLVFVTLTLACVLVSNEIGSIRRQLVDRNEQLKDIVERIQQMAILDDLTQLFNRRHGSERLQKMREMANRQAFGFSVLYLDLDHFKQINDTHGHHIGDLVIRHFAKVVREHISDKDFAARWGGEEFLVVLVKVTPEQAEAMAENLRQHYAKTHIPERRQMRLSVSVGLAHYQIGETVETCISRADQALYDAKKAGRNRVQVASTGEREIVP